MNSMMDWKLPASVRARLGNRLTERDMKHGRARLVKERLDEKRAELSAEERHLADIERSRITEPGERAHDAHEKRLNDKRALVAALRQEVQALSREYAIASEEAQSAGRLYETVRDYLDERRGTIREVAAPEVKLGKGETALDAIERMRSQIEKHQADLMTVKRAPLPSKVTKERMRDQVAALAEAGRPDVTGLVARGEAIKWPTKRLDAFGAGLASVVGPDPYGALAWLFREAFEARLSAEIDDESDDASALDPTDRVKKVQEIRAEILGCERREVALIEMAATQGMVIAYRENTDPRALLGVE